MKPSTSLSVLVLLLVAAFAWSGLAYGLNCACEAATGACIKCCGSETSGFKHCGLNGNGPVPPPAVIYAPYGADKAMPSPAEELFSPAPAPAPAPAAAEAAPEPHATGDKAKPTGKPPMPDKTPVGTKKDKP